MREGWSEGRREGLEENRKGWKGRKECEGGMNYVCGGRVAPIMLIFNPVILFCNSCHLSLLFLLHAPIIPVMFFSNQLPHEIYIR